MSTVQIDENLSIHYEISGSGDIDILLLPGWTMSTEVFQRQLAYFENSNEFRFITLDPRAHGQSSKTEDGHFYEQHGRDLNAFIEQLKLDKLILGGWSFGTLAILSYIHQFGSERLSALMMLDGPPRAASHDSERDWVSYQYDDADGRQALFTLGKLREPEETNREFAKWMLEDQSEANIDWLVGITQQTPNNAAALLNATSVFLDYENDLIALEGQLPLCYIMRAELRTKVNQWRNRHTPSAEIHAFGEHLMFWEKAEQFNRILENFGRKVIA